MEELNALAGLKNTSSFDLKYFQLNVEYYYRLLTKEIGVCQSS